jgi:nucleoside-diphosphate-sugar epimerase
MDWTNRSVLITGAGGFIGSHLTERLLREGAHVRALVYSDREGHIGYLGDAEEEFGDQLQICFGNIRDAAFVSAVTRGMDTVFHLSAITSVVYSYSNPTDTVTTNVVGTLNICNAARHENIRRLVHTSSAGVYGSVSADKPIDETHPVRCHNPYTASKLAADNVVESYHLSYDMPVSTIRIFNIFGPRVSPFLVIPTIILQLMEGDDLKLGDLDPTRNFTYVDDIVEAFMLMAESEAVVGEVVNFGSPEAVTIGQLAEMIARLMGKEMKLVSDSQRLRPAKSEIRRVEADISKARELLGWQPKISLEDGLRRTIDWVRDGGYSHNRR